MKVGLCDGWHIIIVFLREGWSTIPPLFSSFKVLSNATCKAAFSAEIFSESNNFPESLSSLDTFPARTNLKLHNISVTF